MNNTNVRINLLSAALLASSAQLYASEPDHETHETHETHVHGEAQLLIALEGNSLEIEFLSPAANIVGFEHLPVNTVQRQAVESAIDTLKQASLLFSFPPTAKCDSVSIEVESPLTDDDAHDHEERAHSDFTGHYHYQCANMSLLDKIEIDLFRQFPGVEHLEVQSISKRGQQKIDLTPGHSTLEF